MRASRFGATRIQRQRVLLEHKALRFGHGRLALFDFRIVKLFNAAAIKADQMVVVRAFVELINRFTAFKIAACEQAGLFKLCEHTVDRRQADVGMLAQQNAVDIFCRHVPLCAALENLHDLQARQRGLQASVFEFVQGAHGGRLGRFAAAWCAALPLQWFDHNLCPFRCLQSATDQRSARPEDLSNTCPMTVFFDLLARTALSSRAPHRAGVVTAIAAACLSLTACSTFNNATGRIGNLVSPYKVDVVQGNFVSKEQREALQVGMPRAQVRDILGSPLVTSAFHADRWDYVFTILRQGQAPQQRKLTVIFKGDELAKVESDELISEEEFVKSLSAGRSVGKVPLLEVPPEVLREFGIKNAPPNTAVATANVTPAPAATSYPPLEAPGAVTSAWDASTQRAVAASAAARPVASASSNAPLLTAQAPVISVAPPPSAAPAPARAPAATPVPAPTAPVASTPAPAPAPAATPAPAVTPAPAAVVAPVAAAAVAATAAVPAPVPAPIAATPTPAPAPARPVQAAPAPTPAPAAVQAAPAPVPPAPVASASTLASADPDITTFLNRWTSDWQARNTSAYFSHYLPDFKGTSETRAEWEALRRTRIEGRTRISLGVFDVRVRMVSPTEARLVFRQDYDSDAFKEVGTKAMFLVKRDGRWLIEREFFTPAAR